MKDVADTLIGAIHFPYDESGDAHRFCCVLAQSLARHGVEFRGNVDVLGCMRTGPRVSALQTSAGMMEAEGFVVCAGSYSPRMVAGIGLKLPIQPVKGYSITVPMTEGSVMPRMALVDDARHAALTPMDGRLRVAGTAEFAGFDTRLSIGRIENLKRVVKEIFPKYAPEPSADVCAWAGLRPYTCDGVPIIGRTHVDNIYLNTGHGHLGWTLAAGSGKLLSQLISGSAPEIDPAPYSPMRF